MAGTDSWDWERVAFQPQTQLNDGSFGYIGGFLRWSQVGRGNQIYTAWIPCYPNGKPITYADGNQPGSITIQANGSYFTA